jgi:hypothetical protein
MGLLDTLLRRALRRVATRLLERGGKLVGRFFDTSADAPDTRTAPKRNVYDQMHAAPATEGDAGDDHDHDHGHAAP